MNQQFKRENNGLDLLSDSMSKSRLYEAAENSKIELSNSQSTSINLPYITADQTGPKVIFLNKFEFIDFSKN